MNDINCKKRDVVTRFHQFVKTQRGPVNTAVMDLLTGKVFQVENKALDALESNRYDDAREFINVAREEELMIDINCGDWIPPCGEIKEEPELDVLEKRYDIELHLESGVEMDTILDKLENHSIVKVVFYGSDLPRLKQKIKIEKRKKNFRKCIEKTCMKGDIGTVNEHIYRFNKKYNSCWGSVLAVTKDHKVRPCIYSEIVVGDILNDDSADLFEKLQKYWHITKDKVDKCKECELRYVCFDCREIPYRHSGVLHDSNPLCKYDIYKGTWSL